LQERGGFFGKWGEGCLSKKHWKVTYIKKRLTETMWKSPWRCPRRSTPERKEKSGHGSEGLTQKGRDQK